MVKNINCPDCGKLIGKREEKSCATGIYLWCHNCKKNVDIEKMKTIKL